MTRLYWLLWALATATTGLLGGLFLGHALLLGRFLDWLLISGRASTLAATYPLFREGPGRTGLEVFYAVAALQVLAGVAFGLVSLSNGRARWLGVLVGLGAIAWPIVHYASGFAAVESRVLRSATEAPPDAAIAFVAWNGTVHLIHVTTLFIALIALLAVPLVSARPQPSGARPRGALPAEPR